MMVAFNHDNNGSATKTPPEQPSPIEQHLARAVAELGNCSAYLIIGRQDEATLEAVYGSGEELVRMLAELICQQGDTSTLLHRAIDEATVRMTLTKYLESLK